MSYSLSDKEFQSLLKGIQSTGYSAAIPESTPAPKEQGIFGDFVDSVQKGAYEGLGNLAAGVNALTGGGNRFLGEVSAWAGKKADEQLDTMSGEMKKALSQSAFDGFDDETGEAQGVLNLHWWAGNFGAFLGQNLDTVATLGVGKIATTGVKMAGKALTKESAEQIGEAAIKEAAKRGIPAKYSNAIGYSAIMGAMAAGGRDNQVREELNAYSEEDLAQIEGFREEYFKLRKDEQFSDKDDRFVFDLARENFTAKAGRSAALNPTALATDLAAGLVGGLGGGLGGIFAAGKTVKGGLLKGAAIEAATEGVQGAVEQRAINETARQYYDTERDLNEGVGEAVAEGMVLGGAFGGVFGGVDSGLNNRAIGKQKRRILEAINTGDEEIDARLKAHAEMANQFANDLDDLVSVQQRIHSMNQRAQEVVRQQAVEEQARLAEEEAQRAKAEAFAETPAGMFAKFKQDGLTDAEIDQYLTAQVSAKTKHLDELRAKPFQMSDDYEASLVAKQQYHADLANTEAELARWQSLVDYHKQGKSSAPSEQAVEMPLNFANTETAAPPESSEANRYSFAGVNARTANHSLLEQAKSAIVEGKDPEAVRQETGWFTGKDGKWRFEIDDSQVQLKTPYADGEIGYAIDPDFEGRTVALSELIDAPQLFAAYPDLAGLQVNTQTAGSSFYSPEKDIISLNGSRTGDSAKSSLLHEIQHAIQARENFAKGSNPGKFKEMTEAELSEKPLITLLKNASQSSREAYHQFRNAEIKLQNYPDNQEIRKAYDRAEQHLLNQADGEQILTAYWSIDGGQALVSPEEQYMRSAGEVEARNVQTRMGMTAEERQMTSPLSTEDRPYHQQTVSFDYEPSYELDENANSGFARAVDSVFSSTEKVHPTRWIELGTTPQALIQSGISDKKMLLSNSKLVKIKHDHPEMTADLLKQIPRELNNPVAVFKNTKAGSPHNSYVVLTELQAENGESVIVALHADKTDRGLEFNKLASIYGRNESRTYIKNMVEKSDVRFVDTQKAGRISRELQLLSGDTLNLLFDGASVVKTEEGVKYQDKEIRKLLRVKLGNRAAQQIELVSRRNPPQGANIESLITQGVEGWFNPKTGNITLIEESIQATSTMSREARLTWVAWHELAHRGVKVQFQGRYSAIMQKADKNSVVKAIADRIQAERQGANDLAATNRDVAVEEAIAELYSAFETGNYEELRQRYGAKITPLHEKNFRSWFENLAVLLREFFAKLTGKEVDGFSTQQLFELLKEVQQGTTAENTKKGEQLINNFSLLATDETVALRSSLLSADRLSDLDIKTEADLSQYQAENSTRYSRQAQDLSQSAYNQIKSAADNNGEFSAENDDIRYSRRPKSESLEKLRRSETIRISGTEIEPSEDFKQYRRNAMEYGRSLRGSYTNKDTGQVIELGRAGITEVLHHDLSKPEHLQSIAAIPQIIENAVYIDTFPNEDVAKNPHIKEYDYYAAGLNIGGTDYTVKAAVSLGKNGDRYYDHKLTKIEKGKLLSLLDRLSNAGASENYSPLSEVDDKRLLQVLQDHSEVNIRYSRAANAAMGKLGLGQPQSVFEQAAELSRQAREKPVSEWKAWATALGKRANAAIFDALAPLKYAEDEAGIADHTKSAYTAARLAAGSASITEAAMLHGLPEFDKDGFVQRKHGTGSKESLVGIMEGLGSDVNDFLGWVAGNRAEQLMREGRENNLNQADITYLKGLNRGKEAKFEAARKQLQAWNTAILDLAERSGLLSPAERVKFGNNEFYIPFYREDDDGDPIAPYRKSGLANQNSGIRKLKGSDKATSDLLSNLISNASKVIDASVKNMAMTKAVTNLVDTQVISEISTPTMMNYRQLNSRNGNKLMVKLNGEERMFEVHDQGLFNALTNIDQKPMDYPMRKIFSGAKRLLTATVTSMPDFMIRNFLRDIVQAATTDRNNMKLGIDSLKGLKSAYAKDGVAVDLMFTGATFGAGNIDAGDPTRAAAKIRKHLRKKGYSAAEVEGYMKSVIWSKDKFEQVFDKYFEVGSAVENANRIAVYQSALAAGKSKAQAALEAKDLMDFSMHGNAYLIRLLGDVLPFFNARLQGLSQLGRALKENPRKVALRGMTMAAVSVALAIMNADNPAYEELPEEEKDNYWHLFVGSEHFRIPKPFEIGVIFGTVPERLFRTTAGYDKTGLFADRVLSAISNTFAFNPMPQLLKPVYEVYSNQNMFTGRAIETMSDQRVRPEDRYDHNTSLVARGLGSLTGTSPKQIEHLVRGYFGTLGMYVLGMTDSAIRTGGNYGVQPHKYWNEYPVLSAVFGGDVNVPPRYTSYMNDFYEYLNEANQIAATVKSYEDDGRKQDALMLKREHAQLLAQRPKLSGVSQEIRQAKARMEMIMASNELSAEQKRTRIDELLRKRNGLVKSVVERMREEDF